MASKKKYAEQAAGSIHSGGFRGFGTQTLPFLRALADNNDREWFAVNKSTYLEECDTPLRELVRAVGAELQAQGIPLAPPPKNSIFRIYRDVRFSTDKSPYKTNLGIAFFPDGDKTRPGLLYIHIEPAKSFLAAGFYNPDSDLLKAYRAAIVADPTAFEVLVRTLQSRGLVLGDGEPLIRMPKGFEAHADSPLASYLRKRSLITSQPLTDDDLERRDLPEVAVRFVTAARPLLDFFQQRIKDAD